METTSVALDSSAGSTGFQSQSPVAGERIEDGLLLHSPI